MDLSNLLARVKTLGGALTSAQRISLAAAFVLAVVVVGGSTYWLQRTDYVLLFSDMDPEAANDVITRLKASKVEYVVDSGGRSIRVPADRADELRLEFASSGLPSSGRIGFEIFDRTAFGATEFLEQVNYRRALEGEIARTIGTLGEVSSARVHIAMAHSSLFAAKELPAKASVVLKLRGNRSPSSASVQGIANLVASAVEGLRPEAVVILDSFGRPLARPLGADEESAGGGQMERQQRIERDLTMRVVSLLEPVIGKEGLRVNVSVRLDSQSEEATEEKWDPAGSAIRSHQLTGDMPAGGPAAQGLAGSRSNLPAPLPSGPTPPVAAEPPGATPPTVPTPTPALAAGVMLPAVSRGSETTNYEISKTVRHLVRPRGEIARLSVAVILDNEPVNTKGADGTVTHTMRVRTPEDLQKIQSLVGAAVGLDATRGDLLTIENVPFEEITIEPDPPVKMTFWTRTDPRIVVGGGVLGIVILAGLVFLLLIRPRLRRATVTAVAVEDGVLPEHLPRSVRDLEGEIEARLDAAAADKAAESLKLPVLVRRLGVLATKEPEHAARLLRMWISQEKT